MDSHQSILKLLEVKEQKGDGKKKVAAAAKEQKSEQAKMDEVQQLVQEKLQQLEQMKAMQEGLPNVLEQKAAQNEPLMKEAERLNTKMQNILKDTEQDNKEKITQVQDIFDKEIVELFTQAYQDLLQMGMDSVSAEYLVEFHEERQHASKILLDKYNLLSREYSIQNKDFKTKHEQIKADEIRKFEEIRDNFENHFKSIREQMDEEQKQLVDEEGVYIMDKESDELEKQYEELLAEITDKEQLMDKSRTEKESTRKTLTEEMKKTMESQGTQLVDDIEKYKEAIKAKKTEETEYQKMLKEYRDRYQEFDKCLKQSRQNYNKHEREVAQLKKTVNQLDDIKKKSMLAQWERWAQKPENAIKAAEVLKDIMPPANVTETTGGKKKKKNKNAQSGANYTLAQQESLVKFIEKQNEEMDAQIKEMQAQWEVEKKDLTEQKDQAGQRCKDLQEKIKQKTQQEAK